MKNDDPITFKILQVDSGAEQYIGFAKAQARRLAEGGAETCTRTWAMGGATVEIQYTSCMGLKVAKIKLIGGGLVSYYYSGTVSSPCKGRILDVVATYDNGPVTRVLLNDGTQLASFPLPDTTQNYPPYAGWDGGAYVQLLTYIPNSHQGGTNNFTPIRGAVLSFVVPPDVAYPTQSGYAQYDFPWAAITLSQSSSTSFPDDGSPGVRVVNRYDRTVALAGYDGPSQQAVKYLTGYAEVRVQWLPDLSKKTPAIFGGYQITAVNFAVGQLIGDSLNSSILLNGVSSFSTNFTSYLNKIPTSLSSTLLVERPEYAAVSYFSALSEDIARVKNTIASFAVAIVRERARLKLCSDGVKAQLITGPLPEAIHAQIFNGHRASQGFIMKPQMSASTVTTVRVGVPGVDCSVDATSATVTTKTVSLAYTGKDINGNDVPHKQVVTGTETVARFDAVIAYASLIDRQTYYTYTYVNWLDIKDTGDMNRLRDNSYAFSTRLLWLIADYTFQVGINTNGTTGVGLAQIADGVLVAGAASIKGTYGFTTNIQYGSPLSVTYPGQHTPVPQQADTRIWTYPQIYKDYRAEAKRTIASAQASSSWLDATMLDGEVIDIFPVSMIHKDFGDLGIFASTSDVDVGADDGTKLSSRIDMKATYKYTYLTGAWAFVSVTMFDGKTNPDNTVNKQPITLPYQTTNVIFRSRVNSKDEWPDVTAQYRAQAADIGANPTTGSNPVFSVLRAL